MPKVLAQLNRRVTTKKAIYNRVQSWSKFTNIFFDFDLDKLKNSLIMKTAILSLLFFFLFLNVFSQHAPDAFLGRIPDVGRLSCNEENDSEFYKEIDQVKEDLQSEISRRKQESKQATKNFDEQAAKNMMKQQGMSVSDADIQKMKTASKEEKMAMANKMMQQNMNMSIEEAQKASKMSDAGKKAWAEGMTTEMMADAQANPDKNKAAQKNNMNMFEMAQEQSQLAQKIQAGVSKFEKQLEEFKQLKENRKKDFDVCMAAIAKERASRPNKNLGDDSHPDLDKKEEACSQAYCSFLTPMYQTILSNRLSAIMAMGDDYYRMDELTNKLAGSTSGTKKEINEPGLTYLQELQTYLIHLGHSPVE